MPQHFAAAARHPAAACAEIRRPAPAGSSCDADRRPSHEQRQRVGDSRCPRRRRSRRGGQAEPAADRGAASGPGRSRSTRPAPSAASAVSPMPRSIAVVSRKTKPSGIVSQHDARVSAGLVEDIGRRGERDHQLPAEQAAEQRHGGGEQEGDRQRRAGNRLHLVDVRPRPKPVRSGRSRRCSGPSRRRTGRTSRGRTPRPPPARRPRSSGRAGRCSRCRTAIAARCSASGARGRRGMSSRERGFDTALVPVADVTDHCRAPERWRARGFGSSARERSAPMARRDR